MKLAYVLNTYPQGSHTFIRRELQALERRGVTVLRFAMRKAEGRLADPADQAEQDKTEHVLEQGGFALLRTITRQIAKAPGKALQSIGLAWRTGRRSEQGVLRHVIYFAEACYLAVRLGDEDVEHIHAHFGTNAAAVAMLTSALTGIPYSFTVHGPEEFDHPQALDLAEKMRRAAFTVAISQFGRSQLCRWAAPAVWDRIRVVHCGIVPDDIPDPVPLPEQGIRLVCIGRFVEQKGHLTLIEAMARVRDDVPDIHLTLVGDGEMRAQIEAAVRQAGLGPCVSFAGWLDGGGVLAELSRAHALVMPSFAEGLPVVIMEAMASARPVIATYIAGIPELVQPGETGWLVPAGDAQALAEAITDLARTPRDRLRAMGQAGRARVLQRHDIGAETERLHALFRASVAGTLRGQT